MEAIQYVGIDVLDEEQRKVLDTLSGEYYDKVQRQLKNITSLQVHIKLHQKGGARKKYSVHVKAVAPTRLFTSNKSADWDFARTLHKAFKDLEMEIQHGLHADNQRPKSYG